MFQAVFDFLLSLGVDWYTLLLGFLVLVTVYALGYTGLANSGDAKRFLGSVVALVVAKVRAEAGEVSPEFSEVAVMLSNWLIAWVLAAFAHLGISTLRGE